MQDTALRELILDELEFEPSVDAANIGVAVDGGIVTLRAMSRPTPKEQRPNMPLPGSRA